LSTISISEFGIYLTFPPPLLLAIHLEVNPTSHTPRYTPPRLRLGIQNHLSSCPSIRILRRLKSVISGSISTTKSDTCHLRTVLFEKPELAQFVLKRRMKRAANTQYRRSRLTHTITTCLYYVVIVTSIISRNHRNPPCIYDLSLSIHNQVGCTTCVFVKPYFIFSWPTIPDTSPSAIRSAGSTSSRRLEIPTRNILTISYSKGLRKGELSQVGQVHCLITVASRNSLVYQIMFFILRRQVVF